MKQLLNLARKTIKSSFEHKEPEMSKEIKEKFSKKQACFITITKNGQLRGCIGSLQPTRELYKDVVENSVSAAFHDPRFPPLEKEELNQIRIELSILSVPEKLEFKDEKDLLNKINKKMGIVLKKGSFVSTFLPQVWDELPDKVEFLEHLSRKAGLNKDAWKTAEIYFYEVKKIKETF
jgi:AmmeMemoRadiSam system protein A